MNDQAIRFRFGIFVLASLILLAVLTILFGGFPTYFKKTDSYTIVFGNAQGIAPGTPVKRSGVRIGEVRNVELDNVTGKVKVDIRVDGKYFLRKGDRPILQQSLLGGDASIAFMPPEDPKLADPSPVEPNSVLAGVNPADAGLLMQKASDLTEPIQEAVVEIKKSFQAINKMAPLVEDTLRDFREVGKMARDVGPELQRTSEELRALSKATRDILPELRKTNDEIQTTARSFTKLAERADAFIKLNEDKVTKAIDRMDEALKRMNTLLGDDNQKAVSNILRDTSDLMREGQVTVKQMTSTLKKAEDVLADMQRMTKPFGEKGPVWFKNLDESSENLNRTLKDLRELIQVVARSDGTVQRLLSDPSLYNNLNDTAIMTTKILPRLDRVMRDFEIFADKLARHPELLGIGGVVRPSTGIKESTPIWPTHQYRIYP